MTLHKDNFRAFAPHHQSQAAQGLATQIRRANWLSKHAANGPSRATAYRVKAAKVGHGLVQFSDYFRVLSHESHAYLGLLLVVQLPDRGRVHIPYAHLSESARAGLNLSLVPYRRTLPLDA